MSLRTRLHRLEQRGGGRDLVCPACRDRRGRNVLMTARRLPDGTVTCPEGQPAPCERCGVVPEQVVEVVGTVVETREDVDRAADEGGPGPRGP